MEISIKGCKILMDDDIYTVIINSKYSIYCSDGYYVQINTGNDIIPLHRFVMGCTKGDGSIIDHIDHNIYNNLRSNLRFATHTENMQNSVKPTNNTTGYKGVFYSKQSDTFYTRIAYNKTRYNIGQSKDPVECAKLYDMIAIKLHGEYACINFSKEDYTEDAINEVYYSMMSILNSNNSSGYKGVYKRKDVNLWRAYCRIKHKDVHIGYFKTPEEAARAYDKKARELLGDKAKLNFPEEYK